MAKRFDLTLGLLTIMVWTAIPSTPDRRCVFSDCPATSRTRLQVFVAANGLAGQGCRYAYRSRTRTRILGGFHPCRRQNVDDNGRLSSASVRSWTRGPKTLGRGN
jgi:hypothetical protein